MADQFDPYREALVVETETEWPDVYEDWETGDKLRLSRQLHEKPEEAAELEYIRTHTGFCRRIVVTAEDVERFQ